jgi:hypothetical protein
MTDLVDIARRIVLATAALALIGVMISVGSSALELLALR